MKILALIPLFIILAVSYKFWADGFSPRKKSTLVVFAIGVFLFYTAWFIKAYMSEGQVDGHPMFALLFLIPFLYGAINGGNKRPRVYKEDGKIVVFIPNVKINTARSLLGGDIFSSEDHEYRFDNAEITTENGIMYIRGSGVQTFLECSNPSKQGIPTHRERFEDIPVSVSIKEADITDEIKKEVLL